MNFSDWKKSLRNLWSIRYDSASYAEIKTRVESGGRVSGTNMIVLTCAILIASVGLNTDSTAVIIGAMLVSPLMGTIIAVAYGSATSDRRFAERYAIAFFFQVLVSLGTSTLYFLISPVNTLTNELFARTNPTAFDIVIACAGGTAGMIAQTRRDSYSNVIPGVAIATALMPPLCTCGYGIAHANWHVAGGALYLFIINAYFIYLSSTIVLTILQVPRVMVVSRKERRRRIFHMIRNTILIALPIILIALFMNE